MLTVGHYCACPSAWGQGKLNSCLMDDCCSVKVQLLLLGVEGMVSMSEADTVLGLAALGVSGCGALLPTSASLVCHIRAFARAAARSPT